MKTIENIGEEMAYPGRFLILGNTATHFVNVYGVTARSASSRARRYVFNAAKDSIIVETTDAEEMTKGNLELLDYTAAKFFANGVIVSNGRQINQIPYLADGTAQQILDTCLKNEEFEPDKYSTPRITGITVNNAGQWTQALHIIRNDGTGASTRKSFALDTQTPCASFISTYAGPNIRPTPFFTSDALNIEPLTGSAQQVADRVFAAFKPHADEDVRVSIVVILVDKVTSNTETAMVNIVDL